jgi:hypothetical protein
MHRLSLLVTALGGAMLMATVPVVAMAGDFDCRMQHPAIFFKKLEDLPPAIQADLAAKVGGLSPVGGPFDPGDTTPIITYEDGSTEPLAPKRRLIAAGRSGDLYFVWYERGGRGRSAHEVLYRLGVSGTAPEPVAMVMAHFASFNPCLATDAYLDGVWPGEGY